MKVAAFLGLDLGGSGAKAGVYDVRGMQLGFGKVVLNTHTSPEGHTEIPIDEIAEAARCAVRKAVQESGAEIRAIAISSQGETFVSLDDKDRPLHPAIVWYDSRASEQARRLKDAIEESGPSSVLFLEAISTAPKIIWMHEKHAEVMRHARKYLLLPDYISYLLTGRAVTDPCTAVSTGLYADDTPTYSRTALSAAGIRETELAEIAGSGSHVGKIRGCVADEWGLSSDTLVVVGTNDQYAGALGAGNNRPGIVSETTGTCLALVTLTEELPENMSSSLIGGRFPITSYQFALAYAKTAGLVLDWYCREFLPDSDLRRLDDKAELSPIGSNGVVVLPHFDGMVSPQSIPHARGCIANLTLAHSSSDVYRAILESLTFSLRENIELLKQNGFDIKVVRSIGGAAKSDFWLQMKADVTGILVERPKVSEAATLGAAAIGAAGVGEFTSIKEASEAMYRADRAFEPNHIAHSAYKDTYNRYQALWKTLYADESS